MLRRRLGWKSGGHAGTLDPSASGVLLILCGSATRRTEEFMDLPKEYRARIRFGFTTTTDDFEGDVIESHPVEGWDERRVVDELRALAQLTEQIPPTVSAVKVGGRRAYKTARSGQQVQLAAHAISIYEAELLTQRAPEIEVLIRCSRGTYIRSIARDLGGRLGWGGALAGLIRTAVGPYRLECALSLHQVFKRSSEFSGH